MDIFKYYLKHQKVIGILAIAILVLSFFVILHTYTKIGDIVDKDITLKGGVSATIEMPLDTVNIQKVLDDNFEQEKIVRKLTEMGSDKQIGVLIEMESVTAEELETVLEENLDIELNDDNFSVQQVSSALGESFYSQMKWAVLLAFIFMAIVIFITFRTIFPSMAVILSAFFDMFATIAIIDLLGLKLSTSGIAALLLLIGYSVDTDILLTVWVIKRKEGTVDERIIHSMKTGLTMTAAAIAALGVGYFVTNSLVLQHMFLIILIGLVMDVIATYGFNVYLLKKYIAIKEKKQK